MDEKREKTDCPTNWMIIYIFCLTKKKKKKGKDGHQWQWALANWLTKPLKLKSQCILMNK